MKLPKGLILNDKKLNNNGFTIIEVLIALAIFLVIGYYVYETAGGLYEIAAKNQWRANAIAAVENEIELVRNLSYNDVGISGGYPTGKLLSQKTVTIGGINFVISTTVRNIDDPFDGTAGGNPNDTAPADYKLVEFSVNCPSCVNFVPFKMTTTAAPKNLETATQNGSLFINVFDANGQPVSQANVLVVNNALNPTISISDQTNNDGVLQLVDIPTSTEKYEITVSKNGYSSDKTYVFGAPSNPNPLKIHATVVSQQVTSISFAIDKVSSINFKTRDKMCSNIGNIDYLLEGEKLIGADPDVLKYSASSTTDSNGQKIISNLEWDNYYLSNLDSAYDIAGYFYLPPIILSPNTSTSTFWLMEIKNPKALLVTVKNSSSSLINNASVKLEKSGFSQTFYAGEKSFSQTDWSLSQYNSQNGGVDSESSAGKITLLSVNGKYSTSTEEWLISNTFDLGTSDTNFYNLKWQPTSQPPETGGNSLKFQIATNDDNAIWNFIGPDGAANSYYSTSNAQLYSGHNNDRYLRYKAFLKTDDENFTPLLEDIEINFSSECVPSGQVFFDNLTTGTYTLTITKSGYQTFIDSNVSISNDWQEYQATIQL